ncbi:MAG: hypothetical protein ACR2JD_03760 [Nocardioides sp.]
MKPLQALALGLVVVGLRAAVGGFDLLADPLGWLLVLAGLSALPEDTPRRALLLTLATLAGPVAVPLWVPAVADALLEADPALALAVNLPQLAATAALGWALGQAAAAAGDPAARAWLATAATLVVVAAVLPVLVFGGGLSTLEVPTYVAAALSLLLLVVLLFAFAGRPWARPAPDA